MQDKWYSTKKLFEVMKERGVWNSWRSMRRLELEGKLTLPRNSAGHRKLTEVMIDEIATAFLPGGRGEWHYDPQ